MKLASLCLPCRARFPGHLAQCQLCDKPVEHIDLDDAPGKGMPDLVAARVGRRPTDLSWWWTVSWSLGTAAEVAVFQRHRQLAKQAVRSGTWGELWRRWFVESQLEPVWLEVT